MIYKEHFIELYINKEKSIFKKAYKVEAIDTTAAGDSYTGALAVAFANGKNIEDAKLYFQKLRDFETVRGRISTKNGNDFLYQEDKSFEDYYNEGRKK